jgi:ubiquitin carboxyl-terminal hydrolase 15
VHPCIWAHTRYCPGCKTHRAATKEIHLRTLPPVLVVHLKRFAVGRGGYGRSSSLMRSKLGTMVHFPLTCVHPSAL